MAWSLKVNVYAKGGGTPYRLQVAKPAAALVRAERAKLEARLAEFEKQVMAAAIAAVAAHADDPPGKHEIELSGDLDLPSKATG